MVGNPEQNAYLKTHFGLDVDSYGADDADPASSAAGGSADATGGAPAAPPVNAAPASDPKQFYDLGYQHGLQGAQAICPTNADADGQAQYDKGYAKGESDRRKQSLVDRIKGDIKDIKTLKADAAELAQMTMDNVLDVLDQLNKANALEDFAGNTADDQPRIAGATYTVQQNFGEEWRKIVPKLNRLDQVAILKRIPKDLDTSPIKPIGEEDDPNRSLQTDSLTKVESIAKLVVFDGLTKREFFKLEFDVHVGPGGTLTNFEQDLKLFEQKIESNLKNIPIEVTFALDLDNQIKFDTDEHQRITIASVEKNLKASLELAVQRSGKKQMKVRLEASSSGGSVHWEVVFEADF